MEKHIQRNVLLAMIAACLMFAVGITCLTRSSATGIPAHFATEMTWVKCSKCGAEYQISKKEYFEYVEKHHDPRMPAAAMLTCKECGQEGVFRAVKCEKCGFVFAMGSVPRDYQDRCPKCRYSSLESQKKSAAKAGTN